MKRQNLSKKDSGAVFVELLLVLPILLIILASGFEISRIMRFKNAAIQLSHQAASEVFRECSSSKAVMMTPCVLRVQKDMSEFARQIASDYDGHGTSHVAITVFFKYIDTNGEHNLQYTARAESNQDEIDPETQAPYVYGFDDGINIDNFGAVNDATEGNLQTIYDSLNQAVVAQAYVRYRPLGLFYVSRIFTGNYITDYTVL